MRGLWKPYLISLSEWSQFHPKMYEPGIIQERTRWDLTIHRFQARHCLQTVLLASHEGSQQENGLPPRSHQVSRPNMDTPNHWVSHHFNCSFWDYLGSPILGSLGRIPWCETPCSDLPGDQAIRSWSLVCLSNTVYIYLLIHSLPMQRICFKDLFPNKSTTLNYTISHSTISIIYIYTYIYTYYIYYAYIYM
jgi:hypothetical protein